MLCFKIYLLDTPHKAPPLGDSHSCQWPLKAMTPALLWLGQRVPREWWEVIAEG